MGNCYWGMALHIRCRILRLQDCGTVNFLVRTGRTTMLVNRSAAKPSSRYTALFINSTSCFGSRFRCNFRGKTDVFDHMYCLSSFAHVLVNHRDRLIIIPPAAHGFIYVHIGHLTDSSKTARTPSRPSTCLWRTHFPLPNSSVV